MTREEFRQNVLDQEHLKLLSVGYLISAGLHALFSFLGLLYAFIGLFIFAAIEKAPPAPRQGPAPEFVAGLFALAGVVIFLMMVAYGALQFLVYRRLRQRRSRVFCIVVAALSCLGVPYGTLLGVLTLVVLTRPSVAQLFEGSTMPVPSESGTGGGAPPGSPATG